LGPHNRKRGLWAGPGVSKRVQEPSRQRGGVGKKDSRETRGGQQKAVLGWGGEKSYGPRSVKLRGNLKYIGLTGSGDRITVRPGKSLVNKENAGRLTRAKRFKKKKRR